MLEDSGLFTDVGQASKGSVFVTPLLDSDVFPGRRSRPDSLYRRRPD